MIAAGIVAAVVALIVAIVFWPKSDPGPAPAQSDAQTAVRLLTEYPATRAQGRFIDATGAERPFTSTALPSGGVWGTFNSSSNDQPVEFVVTDDGVSFLKGSTFVWESLSMSSDWNGWALAPEGFVPRILYIEADELLNRVSAEGAYTGYVDGWYTFTDALALQIENGQVKRIRDGEVTMSVSRVNEDEAATGYTRIDAVVREEHATIEQVNNRWVVRTPARPEPAPTTESRPR